MVPNKNSRTQNPCNQEFKKLYESLNALQDRIKNMEGRLLAIEENMNQMYYLFDEMKKSKSELEYYLANYKKYIISNIPVMQGSGFSSVTLDYLKKHRKE